MRMLFAGPITADALGWTSGSVPSSQRGNIFPAAAPDPSFWERRNHRTWTFLGYLRCTFGEMGGSEKNGNRPNWFTYIYVAYSYRNGQSEHNYLVCLEVRKHFCSESPYMSALPAFTKNTLFSTSVLLMQLVSESHEKKMHLCYEGCIKSYTNQ